MNTECVVPDWIHDIFLGYGDPAAAHYTRLRYYYCAPRPVMLTTLSVH